MDNSILKKSIKVVNKVVGGRRSSGKMTKNKYKQYE